MKYFGQVSIRLSFLNDLFWIPNALSDICNVNTFLTLLITFLFTLNNAF